MYYPYFRGRQNELLCLRELLESNKLSKNIIPVIEPVHFNSTLFITLEKFKNFNRDIILIRNPEVGRFDDEYRKMKKDIEEKDVAKKKKLQENMERYKEILNNQTVIPAYIVNATIVNKVRSKEIDPKKYVFINRVKGNCDYYAEMSETLEARMTFIPKDEDFKDDVSGETVMLEDVYNKARRNVDYLEKPDDFFSKNHLTFSKRGYQGFSDYSVVGDEYEENGFAPLAIAIHIVYFDEKKVLRVHHFVSDSNGDVSDIPRKFEEAMEKLMSWDKLNNIKITTGLNNLISCYQNGKFPGLGVIKKYSLMHHLELIGDFLGDK